MVPKRIVDPETHEEYELQIFSDKGNNKVYKGKNLRTKEFFAFKQMKVKGCNTVKTIMKEAKTSEELNNNSFIIQYFGMIKYNPRTYYLIYEWMEQDLYDLTSIEKEDIEKTLSGERKILNELEMRREICLRYQKIGNHERAEEESNEIREIIFQAPKKFHYSFPSYRILFIKILKCIESLDEMNLIHRDIKSENFLVRGKMGKSLIVKMGDLNSVEACGKKEYVPAGTYEFIAPEIIDGSNRYSSYSDIWSCGCMFYDILYGRSPFYDDTPRKIVKKIQVGEFHFPPRNVSNRNKSLYRKFQAMIEKMLSIIPEERMNATYYIKMLDI